MSNPFTGLGTALVTPFMDPFMGEEEIRWEAMDWLVQKQIENGVDFLVPCGTTGESPTLSHDEQIKIIEFVVNMARDRVPVLAGAGSNSTREAVDLSQRAKDVGATGVLSVVPYYNKPPDFGIINHYREIAAVGLPVVLYDIPGRTGIKVAAGTIIQLAEEGIICGLKWASGDFNQLMDVIRQRPDGFTVLSGDDNLTYPLMTLGGDGVISVASNVFPGEMKKLISSVRKDDWDTALDWHYKLLDLMRAIFIETNPIPVKTALGMLHPEIFGREPVFRSPMCKMNTNNQLRLQEILSNFKK